MASRLTKPFRIGTSILTKTFSFRSLLFYDGSKAPMHRHGYRDDDASGMQNWRAKGFGACRSTLTQFVSLAAFSSSVPPVAVSFWTLQQDVSVSLKPYLSYRRKTGDDLVRHFWEAVANQWSHWPTCTVTKTADVTGRMATQPYKAPGVILPIALAGARNGVCQSIRAMPRASDYDVLYISNFISSCWGVCSK